MKKHMLIHSGELTFMCEVCDALFNRNDNGERQMRMHTGERPSKSELCRAVFKQYKVER